VADADEIFNPATGERYVFRATARCTGGLLLELDGFLAPSGGVPAEHVHPEQEERFELIAGASAFKLDGKELVAAPGDVVAVRSGVRHIWWNCGASEVHARITFRPALRTEEFLRTLFALVAAGRTDSKGRPGLLRGAVLMHEFRREARPAWPPWGIQRALLPPAAWVGRRLGYGTFHGVEARPGSSPSR
jgi:quercetin dioxygenase-like cupin family protein